MTVLPSFRLRGLRPAAIFVALAVGVRAQDHAVAAAAAPPQQPQIQAPLEERAIDAWRLELLDLAFDAVSRMPLVPHLKNRSRAQQRVVETLFELGQPRRALTCAGRIADFRRGIGYAEFARCSAAQGRVADAERYLQLARRVAEDVRRDPEQQAWRADRVMAHVARVHLQLGQKEQADRIVETLERSELAPIARELALGLDRDDVPAWLASADAVIAGADFEAVHGVLWSCVSMWDRFHDDVDLRLEFERRALTGYEKLPTAIRIELMLALAERAIGHGARARAIELLDGVRDRMKGFDTLAESGVQLRARIAALRYAAGDEDGGREQAASALAEFDRVRDDILPIFRADALVPVAEAMHAVGDDDRARAVYARAIAETEPNPNSRPRGDDLVLVCTSMARLGVTPAPEFVERLQRLAAVLGTDGNPW
ncbi:MAG: hypothetical protein AB7O97_04430 [Planctomycetota bacterium]